MVYNKIIITMFNLYIFLLIEQCPILVYNMYSYSMLKIDTS